jgi:hypothetical protein
VIIPWIDLDYKIIVPGGRNSKESGFGRLPDGEMVM